MAAMDQALEGIPLMNMIKLEKCKCDIGCNASKWRLNYAYWWTGFDDSLINAFEVWICQGK